MTFENKLFYLRVKYKVPVYYHYGLEIKTQTLIADINIIGKIIIISI